MPSCPQPLPCPLSMFAAGGRGRAARRVAGAGAISTLITVSFLVSPLQEGEGALPAEWKAQVPKWAELERLTDELLRWAKES